MTDLSVLKRDQLGLSAQFCLPENNVQQILCEIYRDAFGLDQIGIDDNFFELGGDSLVAAKICTDISNKLKLNIQPGILSRNRTVRSLVLKLKIEAPESSILQTIQKGKLGVLPIFILPGNSGFTILRPAFLDLIGADIPIYAFQIPGLSSPAEFPKTIEDLAQNFVQEIVKLKHVTAFQLVSFCGTGVVMLHMVEMLNKLNRSPSNVVLVDPSFSLALPLLREKLRRQGKSLSLSAAAYLRMKYQVFRKLGRWHLETDKDGKLIAPPKSGKFVGSHAHEKQVRNLWSANFESAMAASTAYGLVLKTACPPIFLDSAHMITSKGFWQGRSRADVDAARIFVPNAKWQQLDVKTHNDLVVKDQSELAVCLRQLFSK